MSDDVGKELRRFRGFMNRDEANRPLPSPPTSDRPPEPLPEPLPEDNRSFGVLDFLWWAPDLVYGALVLIIGAIIVLFRS